MIDYLVRDIPNARLGFRLIFSGQPFPGWQKRLKRKNTAGIGTHRPIRTWKVGSVRRSSIILHLPKRCIKAEAIQFNDR